MREPRSSVLRAPVTSLQMEDQGDQNLAVTRPSSLKSSLPPICVLDGPPGQYFRCLQRHAMALQSPMTIFETSAPSSPLILTSPYPFVRQPFDSCGIASIVHTTSEPISEQSRWECGCAREGDTFQCSGACRLNQKWTLHLAKGPSSVPGSTVAIYRPSPPPSYRYTPSGGPSTRPLS